MPKPNYTYRIDNSVANVQTIGKAAVTASETDAVWQIMKIDDTTSVQSIKWASGTDDFDKKWSLRATYTYS
jgi:hypothetical protein